LVAGLIRSPASRSIGCDNSATDGMLRRGTMASTSRLGPTVTVGNGCASRMSITACGGVM
jgi:hypothetical protein